MKQERIDRALQLRELAEEAQPGEKIRCPMCEKPDVKTEFLNIYCSERCRYRYNQLVARPLAKELFKQHTGTDPFGTPPGNHQKLGHR